MSFVESGGVFIVADVDRNEMASSYPSYSGDLRFFGAQLDGYPEHQARLRYVRDEQANDGHPANVMCPWPPNDWGWAKEAYAGVDQVLAVNPLALQPHGQVLLWSAPTASVLSEDLFIDQGRTTPLAAAAQNGLGYAALIAAGVSSDAVVGRNPDNIRWLCNVVSLMHERAARERALRQASPQARRTGCGKYAPLHDHLAQCAGTRVRMTFAELEALVGRLPDSAYRHRAWWGNNDATAEAKAWLGAGWRVESVDQAAKEVAFARVATGRQASDVRRPIAGHAPSAPYVDPQVAAGLEARAVTMGLDSGKLIRLIAELNDNYGRGNAYAAHALLRAILDHVPPLLGYADFKAAANNHSWSRTDRNYARRLLDFKLQADDALHRQISKRADSLHTDDMPPKVWVNTILQECANTS